jgi:PadR family transcriptional regulator PadR
MSPRPTGLVTSLVLRAIAEGHRHGADVMAATGHGGGTVYKVLRRLENRELIEGVWEDPEIAERQRRPRRRYYRLTDRGTAELEAAMRRYGELGSRPLGEVAPEGSR